MRGREFSDAIHDRLAAEERRLGAGGYLIIEVLRGYGVDHAGNVYCRRPINGKGEMLDRWRRLNPMVSNAGRYLQISVDRGKASVHRLVARAFLGPCPPGLEVGHRNGNGQDNHATNLQYVTHAENEAMKREHGTYFRRGYGSKLDAGTVRLIRARAMVGPRGTMRALASELGVCQATISRIVSGKTREEV